MPISIDLSNKTALVTGGTRGIGRTISLRLAQAGAQVGLIYRSDEQATAEALELLKSAGSADHFALRADISVEEDAAESVESAIQRFGGRLDILVLNAASGTSGNLAETSISDWQKPFATNLHGHLYVCRAAYAALQPKGSVVFISSGAGHDPIAGLGAYGVSKAAVNHLAAVLAQEWGPSGIRVNVVSPGHTAMKPVDYDNLSDKQRNIVETTALRRLGTPEDVADTVLYFASDLSSFVTGQFLRVNGGRV